MPARSHGWFRTWFRKIWDIRGGGLYACGFAISFLILEVGSIADDVQSFGQVFNGELIAYAVSFFVDSLMNTVKSFMWPAFVAQFMPPFGAIGLGLAFWLFPIFLKKPIENWIFEGEPPPPKPKKKKDAT